MNVGRAKAPPPWPARTFPLVLVDEAQDFDEHRMRGLQGLSQSFRIAAADAFQCLHDGRNTAPLMGLWPENQAKPTGSRSLGAPVSRACLPPRSTCAKAGTSRPSSIGLLRRSARDPDASARHAAIARIRSVA